MADSKISALTAYTTPIATDVLPIVDVTSGTTKKITIANLGGASSPLTLNGFPANATPTANNIPVLDGSALLPASLLLKSKAITATRDLAAAGAPTDIAYTGVGFTPTSIQVIFGVDAAAGNMGSGMVDSSKTAYCFIRSANGTNYKATAFVYADTNGGNYHSCSVKSFDALPRNLKSV